MDCAAVKCTVLYCAVLHCTLHSALDWVLLHQGFKKTTQQSSVEKTRDISQDQKCILKWMGWGSVPVPVPVPVRTWEASKLYGKKPHKGCKNAGRSVQTSDAKQHIIHHGSKACIVVWSKLGALFRNTTFQCTTQLTVLYLKSGLKFIVL